MISNSDLRFGTDSREWLGHALRGINAITELDQRIFNRPATTQIEFGDLADSGHFAGGNPTAAGGGQKTRPTIDVVGLPQGAER
jgi:hypothetical protein